LSTSWWIIISLRGPVFKRTHYNFYVSVNTVYVCIGSFRYFLLFNTCLGLTLNLLMWRIWWARNNASKWQMGFNSLIVLATCSNTFRCRHATEKEAVLSPMLMAQFLSSTCNMCLILFYITVVRIRYINRSHCMLRVHLRNGDTWQSCRRLVSFQFPVYKRYLFPFDPHDFAVNTALFNSMRDKGIKDSCQTPV